MKRNQVWQRIALLLLAALTVAGATRAHAGPTNAILFVTQLAIPDDFTTIGSTFGNHQPDIDSCGRGGDLWIRYPDGTLKNLTRAAGYGLNGAQHTNGIAVRQPSVYWDGKKAVFSMVVGAPKKQFDYASTFHWQLYEITNFLDPASVPIISKVTNQPANYNNISPVYGTDDRIIFSSDRPRDGSAHLYPQLDEYEEAPTVTGLWSLDPATGDLFLLNHAPSGAFSPSIDSAGRVTFVRWDHMQRDQQADADNEDPTPTYGTFDWSSEAANSFMTTNRFEVFPEPRYQTGVFNGHTFNQFFPWQINEDGTEEETINHVGRHELGGSYRTAGRNDDPNIKELYYFGNKYNTNIIENFLQLREDNAQPGRFLGIDAPEFATHSGGQLVALSGGTNLNADFMRITYLTPRATSSTSGDPSNPPADHTGFYRNPLATTDGWLIAAHTAYTGPSANIGTGTAPKSPFDFRLKFLTLSNGFYVAGTPLTPGLTNAAVFWTPDVLVYYTNSALWEFDPVEVVARTRPARRVPDVQQPERQQFTQAGVDVEQFRGWLAEHNLALIISRDMTTRDHADFLQPFNLRVAGTNHQTIGASGKVYDISWLQLFQGDQLRSMNFGNTNNPRAGRRVLAREMHDPVPDNVPVSSQAPAGSVKIGADGSMAALVPARRAMSWQLVDTNGTGVVRERYWLTFQPGEIRTCASCHGVNTHDQANDAAPTNSPSALGDLLTYWKGRYVPKPAITNMASADYPTITFARRLAAINLTYTVELSTNLVDWVAGSQYSASNSVPNTTWTAEVSRNGTTNETIVVRSKTPLSVLPRQFLRVQISSP